MSSLYNQKVFLQSGSHLLNEEQITEAIAEAEAYPIPTLIAYVSNKLSIEEDATVKAAIEKNLVLRGTAYQIDQMVNVFKDPSEAIQAYFTKPRMH